MLKKPDKCCECGTYGCTIPMAVGHRVIEVDYCIASLVAALEAANMEPIASCCGHGKMPGSVLLNNNRALVVLTHNQAKEVIRLFGIEEE